MRKGTGLLNRLALRLGLQKYVTYVEREYIYLKEGTRVRESKSLTLKKPGGLGVK